MHAAIKRVYLFQNFELKNRNSKSYNNSNSNHDFEFLRHEVAAIVFFGLTNRSSWQQIDI